MGYLQLIISTMLALQWQTFSYLSVPWESGASQVETASTVLTHHAVSLQEAWSRQEPEAWRQEAQMHMEYHSHRLYPILILPASVSRDCFLGCSLWLLK